MRMKNLLKKIMHSFKEFRYAIHCWFHRYTVVRPRTLRKYHYFDPSELIAHAMFEILTEFLLVECELQPNGKPGPGCRCDWYPSYDPEDPGTWNISESFMKIKIKGKWRWEFDVMVELYRWWMDIYVPYFNGGNENPPGTNYYSYYKKMSDDLDKKLKILIDLRTRLFT